MRLFALKLFDGANVPKDSELYNDKLPDLQVMSKVDKEKKTIIQLWKSVSKYKVLSILNCEMCIIWERYGLLLSTYT